MTRRKAAGTGSLHLRRAKGGTTATHPLLGDELRALRNLRREAKSPFVFVSERNAPFTVSGFAKLVERAGIEAGLALKCLPAHAAPCLRLCLRRMAAAAGAAGSSCSGAGRLSRWRAGFIRGMFLERLRKALTP